ncbi:hypothetical protein PanWU01x14_186610, partial [Parasponia andersonii]
MVMTRRQNSKIGDTAAIKSQLVCTRDLPIRFQAVAAISNCPKTIQSLDTIDTIQGQARRRPGKDPIYGVDRAVEMRLAGNRPQKEQPEITIEERAHRSKGSTTSIPVDDQLSQEVACMRNKLNCLTTREKYQVEEEYSPFSLRIQNALIPDGYKMLTIIAYSEKMDLCDHLDSFNDLMDLNQVSRTYATLCLALANVRQRENESFRSYLKRFNKEATKVSKVPEGGLLMALAGGNVEESLDHQKGDESDRKGNKKKRKNNSDQVASSLRKDKKKPRAEDKKYPYSPKFTYYIELTD